MDFNLDLSLEILERTPRALRAMLEGLSDQWINADEGPDTWSPYIVVGHLIHGERTDWMARTRIILSNADDRRFTPYDRFAQFTESAGKSLAELLDEFETLRARNIDDLRALALTESDLDRTGIHPAFGDVTLGQLLATWTAHDMDHIIQIARVIAKQYTEAAGPWVEYLRVLKGEG